MEIAYWCVAGFLAAFYLFAGSKKSFQSKEALQPMMAWAGTTVPMPVVRLIGILEILGAIGLILPPLTDTAPVLALLAAIGFAVLQVLAAREHLSRGEKQETALNAFLIALAVVAAWLATTWL